MRRRTRSCGQHGHPEFELEVGEVAPVFSDGLLAFLEEAVAEGERFAPGETVQFGPALLTVHERADGSLALYEPAADSDPPQFIDSVASSVMHTHRQCMVAESLGLAEELDFPNPDGLGYVCPRLAAGQSVAFVRNDKEGRDEGWCVVCLDEAHDHNLAANIECLPLYALALRIPVFWLFAALPVGTTVILDAEQGVELRLGERELTVEPGSYLDTLLRRGESV